MNTSQPFSDQQPTTVGAVLALVREGLAVPWLAGPAVAFAHEILTRVETLTAAIADELVQWRGFDFRAQQLKVLDEGRHGGYGYQSPGQWASVPEVVWQRIEARIAERDRSIEHWRAAESKERATRTTTVEQLREATATLEKTRGLLAERERAAAERAILALVAFVRHEPSCPRWGAIVERLAEPCMCGVAVAVAGALAPPRAPGGAMRTDG